MGTNGGQVSFDATPQAPMHSRRAAVEHSRRAAVVHSRRAAARPAGDTLSPADRRFARENDGERDESWNNDGERDESWVNGKRDE